MTPWSSATTAWPGQSRTYSELRGGPVISAAWEPLDAVLSSAITAISCLGLAGGTRRPPGPHGGGQRGQNITVTRARWLPAAWTSGTGKDAMPPDAWSEDVARDHVTRGRAGVFGQLLEHHARQRGRDPRVMAEMSLRGQSAAAVMGTAASNRRVYGCCGSRNTAWRGPIS